MENQNYNQIAQELRDMGLSDEVIETRLMRLRMSTSGHYNPLSDTYNDLENNEPSETFKIPLPTDADIKRVPKEPVKETAATSSNVPHLQTEEESDLEFLKPFELDPTITDEPIQFCYEIDGIGFSPKGDVQALTGAQKNGKSFFLCLMMGAALRGSYLGVNCLIKNPKVLYCDTEQHPRNTRLIYRRVCQIAGIDGHIRHEQINMQHLRLADDIETIKKAIQLKIKYFKPDICLIDGLVDCLIDFNDATESKRVITEFSKVALENNCCIWCVLHTNPNDDSKMRGHVGTLLSQKASDVVLCVKSKNDDGTTVFTCEQTDNRNNSDFAKFSFAVEYRKDERGEFIAVPVKAYVSIQEKSSLDELFKWALKEPLRRSDLKDRIISDDCPKKVSRSTAYQKINEALAAGIIKDDNVVTHQLRYVGLDMPNEDGMPF